MVCNAQPRRTAIAALIAATIAITGTTTVMAGGGLSGGATEVTQILNNTQLALQSVKQEMQYALQMQQYVAELQQLMPGELIAFGEFVLDAQETITAAQQVYNAGSRLYGSLEELQLLSDNRFKQFAASGLTWEDYLQREAALTARSGERTGVLNAHEAHVARTVQRNHENFQRVANEIPRTQGSHEALQVLNGQMAMLNGTMNEALHFQLAQSQRQSDMDVDEAVRRAAELRAVTEEQHRQQLQVELIRRQRDQFGANR